MPSNIAVLPILQNDVSQGQHWRVAYHHFFAIEWLEHVQSRPKSNETGGCVVSGVDVA